MKSLVRALFAVALVSLLLPGLLVGCGALGEALAVDEDDAFDGGSEVDGVAREGGSGDEDALVGALAGEGAVEALEPARLRRSWAHPARFL